MNLLNHETAPGWTGREQPTSYITPATPDMPARMPALSNDLYDRVFDFARDVMGDQALDRRGRSTLRGDTTI
jgi:hypothetical protein